MMAPKWSMSWLSLKRPVQCKTRRARLVTWNALRALQLYMRRLPLREGMGRPSCW